MPLLASRDVLELNVGELRQLFDAMDPAPFRERSLDPNAEEYIVDWGREGGARRGAARACRAPAQQPAVQAGCRRGAARRPARPLRASGRTGDAPAPEAQLFRVGRVSLLIGLAVRGRGQLLGALAAGLVGGRGHGRVLLTESVAIGSWVALWRPLEIFLYDWWPLRDEARLYDRLAAMDVRVLEARPRAGAGAWRA